MPTAILPFERCSRTKMNKLRYTEYIFRNMYINLHVNGAQSQGLAENFFK